jgi:methyltransferase
MVEALFTTKGLFTLFVLLTAIERLIEVRVSNRNSRWSFERGGTEYGQGHYPFMVLLHTTFLIACVVEVWILDRPFFIGLGLLAYFFAFGCQIMRWWCISSLGPRWNTRVIIVPNLPKVSGGPYRYLNHPNYVIVALEGIALPMAHSAYWTALAFTGLNAALMIVRIRCENDALSQLPAKDEAQ